jgi:hypothetical protein
MTLGHQPKRSRRQLSASSKPHGGYPYRHFDAEAVRLRAMLASGIRVVA